MSWGLIIVLLSVVTAIGVIKPAAIAQVPHRFMVEKREVLDVGKEIEIVRDTLNNQCYVVYVRTSSYPAWAAGVVLKEETCD